MNYYDARQRPDNGKWKWDYTRANRRTGIHAIGYCAEHIVCPCWTFETGASPGCEQCGGSGRIANPDYCGSHHTAAEARQCFALYLLADISEQSYGNWQSCEVCDAPTKKGLTTRRPHGRDYSLCDEHRTPKQVEQLAPSDVGQIISSD